MSKNQAIHQRLIEHLKNEDKLVQLLEQKGPQAYLARQHPFALLVGAIMGQRISFSQARKQRAKLYTLMGTRDFTADHLLKLTHPVKILREQVGVSEAKAQLIHQMAQHPLADRISLDTIDSLQKVKGIGPWTINNVKFMMGIDNDEFLIKVNLWSDLVIRRNVKKLWGITTLVEFEKKIGELVLEGQVELYRYLVWFLWRCI